MSNTTFITQEQSGPVCTVTLNRPEKRNALSLELLENLWDTLKSIGQDSAIQCVILKANGPVFSSGHDLNEMPNRTEEDYHKLFSTCAEVMQQLKRIPQPVVAGVQGLATAAGCQLVAACDLAIASTNAKFATPGVKIGLFCTTPMVALVRKIPAKVAMEMLLTGEPIDADRAYEIGLVNKVVPPEYFDSALTAYAEKICTSSPLVNTIGKHAFYDQIHLAESDAYHQAVDVMTQNMLTHDAQEGISAFLEKRKPQWKSE